jgi:hypothetical protein
VLSGAIGDFGEAVSVLPNGTVDPEHSSQEKLLMTQGSLPALHWRLARGEPLHRRLGNHHLPRPRPVRATVVMDQERKEYMAVSP